MALPQDKAPTGNRVERARKGTKRGLETSGLTKGGRMRIGNKCFEFNKDCVVRPDMKHVAISALLAYCNVASCLLTGEEVSPDIDDMDAWFRKYLIDSQQYGGQISQITTKSGVVQNRVRFPIPALYRDRKECPVCEFEFLLLYYDNTQHAKEGKEKKRTVRMRLALKGKDGQRTQHLGPNFVFATGTESSKAITNKCYIRGIDGKASEFRAWASWKDGEMEDASSESSESAEGLQSSPITWEQGSQNQEAVQPSGDCDAEMESAEWDQEAVQPSGGCTTSWAATEHVGIYHSDGGEGCNWHI